MHPHKNRYNKCGHFRESSKFIPRDRKFLSRVLGFFIIWWFLSPGIGNFWKFEDFYPRDWVFFKDFLGMRIFLRMTEYPQKAYLCS